jgi:hypothetical protein
MVPPRGPGDVWIDGELATFRNARREPLHSWYPYLEGFAAGFVETLLERYLSAARRVIDPFAGTGTTPLVLAQRGLACAYCEANPFMRFIIAAKAAAIATPPAERARLAAVLDAVSGSLRAELAGQRTDDRLRAAYGVCFGTSRFFEPQVMETVLALRALCDRLAVAEPQAAELCAVAVAANLVACSLLKRAGDVRYKTPTELGRGVPDLAAAVAAQLSRMAGDLRQLPGSAGTVRLLAGDARALGEAEPFDADGAITSPPYLNGTNYIRNTKLELWFLRLIAAKRELRELRDRMVTSGINDVTARAPADPVVPELVAVLAEIGRTAYDRRIPRMVSAYFADMKAVLDGLALHLRPGGIACIDIGDSRYAGISVPTPDLLIAVARRSGFALDGRHTLRSRQSKDRTPLTQEILVLRRAARVAGTARATVRPGTGWRAKWDAFKQELPHQAEPYTRRNWGHPLHSACSYQGKMKPALAHFLVRCFSEPGERILDPFSGAGTIPFEAALQGRRALGMDISTMALAVTGAKIMPAPAGDLAELVARLERFLDRHRVSPAELRAAAEVRFNRPLTEYFHRDTLREVLAARRFFLEIPGRSPAWAAALTAMLHILHGNRPYALSRRSHPVTPFSPSGPFEYRPLIPRLRDKLERNLAGALPASFVPGTVLDGDVIAAWPDDVGDLDAVITSPPFFDSTRFYMANWIRFWFCGWDRRDFDRKPAAYVETLQRRSLAVYQIIFRRIREHLRPGGIAVLHLGRSRKCDMGAELARLAHPLFQVDDVFREDVTHCERHGISAKGTVTSHQYLVLSPA